MTPANGKHAVMQAKIGGLIRDYLAIHRPGCRVLMNPDIAALYAGTWLTQQA